VDNPGEALTAWYAAGQRQDVAAAELPDVAPVFAAPFEEPFEELPPVAPAPEVELPEDPFDDESVFAAVFDSDVPSDLASDLVESVPPFPARESVR
jgi:hypothetical protein